VLWQQSRKARSTAHHFEGRNGEGKKKSDIRAFREMRIGIASVAVGVAIVACGHAVDAFCPSPGYSKVRPRASLLQQILNAFVLCCLYFVPRLFTKSPSTERDGG